MAADHRTRDCGGEVGIPLGVIDAVAAQQSHTLAVLVGGHTPAVDSPRTPSQAGERAHGPASGASTIAGRRPHQIAGKLCHLGIRYYIVTLVRMASLSLPRMWPRSSMIGLKPRTLVLNAELAVFDPAAALAVRLAARPARRCGDPTRAHRLQRAVCESGRDLTSKPLRERRAVSRISWPTPTWSTPPAV
jgi:hypothetical protein